MLPPKTAEQALDLIRSMESHYSAAFDEYLENDAIYDGEIDRLIQMAEGYAPTIPSTARAVVDEAVANVIPSDIIVHYPPRGMNKTAEEDADSVRRFLRGLWRHWRRSSSDIDFLVDAAKNLAMHGVACTKIVPDWTLWPVLPDDEVSKLKEKGDKALQERVKQIKELRERHTPIIVRSLAPRMFMVDTTVGSRKLWIIERYEAGSSEVSSLYARWEQDFREYTLVNSTHRVHEVWTATHSDWKGEVVEGRHFIFIDETLVYEGPNPYGDLPYVIKYSGLGRSSYEGKPELKSVGLYTPQVKSLILAEARRFTQFDAIMAQAAYPIGIFPSSMDIEAFETAPGSLNAVPSEVFQNADKIWLQAKIPGAEYLNSLRAIGAQLERGTTQAALRGAPVTGTDSAAQLDMTTGQARLRLESIKQALEDMLAELFTRALYFIEKVLQDKVSVFVAEKDTDRYVLSPRAIRGRYDVSVTFMPNEEMIKERKLALANDAIVKGGMSPYDALVYAGFDNPSEMIARRMAYDVMQEPLVRRAIAKEYLDEWGIDADEMAMQEQMEQGGMQKLLSDFMNMLQTGSLRGTGDPMTPDGSPPGGGAQIPSGQDPMAALAQQGLGPMALPQGAQPQAAELMPPQAMQQVPV